MTIPGFFGQPSISGFPVYAFLSFGSGVAADA